MPPLGPLRHARIRARGPEGTVRGAQLVDGLGGRRARVCRGTAFLPAARRNANRIPLVRPLQRPRLTPQVREVGLEYRYSATQNNGQITQFKD